MIIVGVDGSQAGLEAAGWAAEEAVLRGVPLTVAHAMQRWANETDGGRYADVAAWMRDSAAQVADAAVQRARQVRSDLPIEKRYLSGDPRPALLGVAAEAELLVIGDHHEGAFRGLLSGAVKYGVAGHAPCPVAVVRNFAPVSSSDIVVGVAEDTPARVLDFAFAEAALRRARLLAVHAGVEEAPSDTLTPHRARHPEVEVVERVESGAPAKVLQEASRDAGLLVVGSHGYGAAAGMLLGSVSRQLLHTALCPLIVVGP
ncbi:universal stress protein [Nonomuraea sp. NPDC050790]|uniref:universal stress protein n=1 Tax=Nonomuraea sp. NPDC050790 TaxID=3364371 RepID=UPI0037A924A3